MKKVMIILGLFLTACAEPYIKQPLTYQAPNQEKEWEFTGYMVSNITSQVVSIRIDGQEVVVGQLGPAGNGSLFGNYNGFTIESKCSGKCFGSIRNNTVNVTCLVLVDNEESVTMKF